jgi:ElaB/YqjD/DUF883 family membrane-anchored ribosome-binding protein
MANNPKGGNSKDPVQETTHRAQEAGSSVAHRAQEAASQVGHRAQEAASNLGHRAEETVSGATQQAGQGMSSLASQLRQNAPQGYLGQAAGAVADRLDQGGRYLQDNDLGDMAQDVNALIRRYPIQSLLVGVGVGFLMGMLLTPRR